MSAHPRQRGFTLFEMMITIGIIGILTMFSMPMYRQWLQNSQLRARAESIAAGLQHARTEAVRLNATAGVRFVLTGNDWKVENVATAEVLQESLGADLGKNAVVTATPPANTTITFGPLGSIMPAGTTVDFRVTHVEESGSDSTMKCTPAGEMRCLAVQVRGGGLVRMCDTDPGIPAGDPRKCLP